MPFYEQLRTVISNHLEDLEHNRLPVIQRKTGYSMGLIQETREELRKLNPKPGAAFNDNFVPSVTPDVFVEQTADGNYQIRLEDGRTPNLFISNYYRQLLMNGQADAKAKEYIKQKINSAQWLIDSIQQRRNTLTKVAQAIVDHQTEFLTRGPEYIEPLKMQQIADKVGVHVTTVSQGRRRQMDSNAARHFSAETFLRRRNRQRRRRRGRLGRGPAQAPGNHRQREQAGSALGRRPGRRAQQARHHGRPPHGHQYRKAMNIPTSRQRRDWTAGGGKSDVDE